MIKQITSQVDAASWDSVGGPGSIARLGPKVLVVLQTPLRHREIERRFAKELLPVRAPADRLAGMVPIKGPDPLGKIREALRRPATALYPETPLSEVVAHFTVINRVEVEIDEKALEEGAVSVMTPISVYLMNVPLESLLTLMTQDRGLSWTIDGDKVLITTPKGTRRLIVNYDVRDLAALADEKAIAKVLARTVHPASWSAVGGPGKITAADGTLSVSQTVQIHREIETWLADVRVALNAVPSDK